MFKNGKNWLIIKGMITIPLIWIGLRVSGVDLSEPLIVCLCGITIISAAFLLSWGAEVAQKDISASLAIACIALIAVLPEYAIDLYFSWMAGKDDAYISYATANMTGANRLLIGFGWALMVFIYWIRTKKKEIILDPKYKVELFFLSLATLYSFIIPIKGNLSIFDGLVFFSIFIFYIISIAKAHVIEPELIGPAESIGNLPVLKRRSLVIFFFLYAGVTILFSAEPFAEGLISVGKGFGIDEFIMVQWLAPLASESPEIIIASLFVWKAKPSIGVGTLISSKINQWALLVGMIPVVFCISAGKIGNMNLDLRQIEEIFLTATQSIFGIAVLVSLSISLKEALLLFILFSIQLIFPNKEIRSIFAFLYLGLAIFILIKDRSKRRNLYQFFQEKFF